ncbi:MAG: YihY family inner membrane protein [Rhodocyclaceae bacterium]|nr:YihY family inner membrane protein [Rhodocyclaceae bacterium]
MRWLLAPFRLVLSVVRRFRSERLAQTAAALSFATLLGLVPMLAVGLGLISHFPFAAGMSAALEKFLLANLLPEKAGTVIAKYLGQFAHRAERVTLVGVGALAVTALMQMLTIEHAFNAIWKIKAKRPLIRRVVMHLIALLLGPVAFGGSLVFITFVAGISFGLVDDPGWASAAFFRVLPSVFMAMLFALLYWGVPNRPVSRWHAVAGGLFAALGFLAMQRLFGLYVANFPAYTVMYGAFAAIPIFLVWLYLSWGVILIGALVVAELPGSAKP